MLAFNMTSVHFILSNIGWSDEQMEHQGDLMLSAPLGKLSVCAAILLRKKILPLAFDQRIWKPYFCRPI